MNVQYKFSSLQSFADWCENHAKDIRQRKAPTKKIEIFHNGEAYAWESMADMLRNSVIEEQKKD